MNFFKIKIFLKRFLKKLAYYVVNSFGTLPISFLVPQPYSMIPSMFLAAFIENRIAKTNYLVALGWQLLFTIFALLAFFTENIYVLLGILITVIVLAFVRVIVEKKIGHDHLLLKEQMGL